MKEYAKENNIKYLVIDCSSSLIFIDLDKCVFIGDLIYELERYSYQKILRIGFANTRLTNW